MFSVYLIDDEPLILEDVAAKTIWQECGFEVTGKNISAEVALEEIKNSHYDVVFCDLRMPGMSGVELMGQARAWGVDSAFVMLSAFSAFQDSRDFFTSGGFDYLLKPLDEGELQITLERLSRQLFKNAGRKEATAGEENATIDPIMAYIRQNYTKKMTLSQLGQMFHLSPNYICNLFAKHYSQTFTSVVTGLRMDKAVRLIKTTDKAMKQIASECGYANYFYFCRVFKEYYNCTPSDYLKYSGEGNDPA